MKKRYLMSRRRDRNAYFFRVRSVDDHVAGYLAAVERDVHPLACHQPQVGQRAEAWAHQLGGPVLATPAVARGGTVVEPYRVPGLRAVRSRLHCGYDAGAQLAVVASRRTHPCADNRPLGKPFAGRSAAAATAGGQPVLLPHPDC